MASSDRGGQLDPMPGRLLVATTVIDEPTFFRTVVLLLEHDDGVGTVGVVLNRPTGLDVADAVPQWHAAASAPAVIFGGGPVAEGSVLALASLRGAARAPGFTPLYGALNVVDLDAAGGDTDDKVAELRVYRGYAGWGPGQLRGELHAGAWWVFDSVPGDWFSSRPSGLWASVLERQGPSWRVWANAPDDLEVN